jgi:hypothetical protein
MGNIRIAYKTLAGGIEATLQTLTYMEKQY